MAELTLAQHRGTHPHLALPTAASQVPAPPGTGHRASPMGAGWGCHPAASCAHPGPPPQAAPGTTFPTPGQVGDGDGCTPALAPSPAFQLSAQISLRGAGCLAPKSPARAKNSPRARRVAAGTAQHRLGTAAEGPWKCHHRGGGTGTRGQDHVPVALPGTLACPGAPRGSCPQGEGRQRGGGGRAVTPVPPTGLTGSGARLSWPPEQGRGFSLR